jgi:hypothetical protein
MSTKFDPENPIPSFKRLLTELVRGYEFDVEGLYMRGGAVRPLPKEAAVIGKVLEVSIHEYLARRLLQVTDLNSIPASSDRVYPDITFQGPLIFPHRFALEVKCARRASGGRVTTSAITIGTFDAEYFRNPAVKAPNIMMPYGTYTAHLALIALYDYVHGTARDTELLVVEKWRIATRKRASGTRCYIAAVKTIDLLRQERGDFAGDEDFNSFWRSQPIGEGKEEKWRLKREGAPP